MGKDFFYEIITPNGQAAFYLHYWHAFKHQLSTIGYIKGVPKDPISFRLFDALSNDPDFN